MASYSHEYFLHVKLTFWRDFTDGDVSSGDRENRLSLETS
jgi:hypothetical protein